MERLTIKGATEPVCARKCEYGSSLDCYDCDKHKELLNRLAAYEDTGLTPAQIKYILPKQSAEEAVERMKTEKQRYVEWFAWKQAEQEGRLVVLPCKVGDLLYEIDLPEYGVIKCKVLSVDYYSGPLAHVPNNEMVELWSVGVEVVEGHGTGSCYAFDQTDFGETVFLTREDAENALEGVSEDTRKN